MKLTNKFRFVFKMRKNKKYCRQYAALNILSDVNTLDYILKNHCSVARYGDGEFTLMNDIGIVFQKADGNLKKRLLEIAAVETEKLLVCVPNIFFAKDKMFEVFTDKDAMWLCRFSKLTDGLWRKLFRQSKIGDANISRFYIEKRDKSDVQQYVEKLKTLWDERDVVFVEGKNSRIGIRNDLFQNVKSIKRIICPSKNAFDSYAQIVDAIKSNVEINSLVIIALGPTATVLASDLSCLGYQALDFGHVDIEYEWFKMRAESKVPVFNKDANEAHGGSVGEENDSEYLKQIIVRVQ